MKWSPSRLRIGHRKFHIPNSDPIAIYRSLSSREGFHRSIRAKGSFSFQIWKIRWDAQKA